VEEYKTDYVLDNFEEFKRLEKQALQKNYSLNDELKYLDLSGNKSVLDAGCGSGVLSRHLAEQNSKLNITACDFSEIRIFQATQYEKGTNSKIKYVQSNLDGLPFEDNTFDVVVSRFVYEYLQHPVQITQELKRVLKPGGCLYLIDLDGVFLNFWTSNNRFNTLLKELELGLDFDLYVGRKLPSFLQDAGLRNVNCRVSVHEFKTEIEVREEIENNLTRIQGAREKFTKILGSSAVYEEFLQLYVQEMERIVSEGNLMFFNKMITWGTK